MELELRLALPYHNSPSMSSNHLDAGHGDRDGSTTLSLFAVDNSGGGCRGRRRRDGRCVKVKMDGLGIGRKVDVSLHHSYQELFHTLQHMFPINHHDEYVISYENERGDWMVAGDVPWEVFIESVKQLKILK